MNEPLLIAGAHGYVTAIDRANGAVVWRHDLHDARIDAKQRAATKLVLASEPPFVASVSITYVPDQWHTGHIKAWYVRLICCDYLSGRVLWTVAQDVQRGRVLAVEPSLRIQQGQVLLGLSGVIAFDAASGRRSWQASVVPETAPAAAGGGGLMGALSSLVADVSYDNWTCQFARRE